MVTLLQQIAMSYTTQLLQDRLRQWIAEKREVGHIEQELLAMGHDAGTIELHVREYRKYRHGKRLTTGFIWMGAGAFLGFISCVLSLINPVPELYYWILYGLTSVAIAVIFVGLYFVFE